MTTCTNCAGTGTVPQYGMCVRCMGTGTPMIGMGYAGVGSRDTPLHIAQQMGVIAMNLALRGLILRSGGAKKRYNAGPDVDSADLAFEQGCDMMRGKKVIRCITGSAHALDHAARFHPNWGACDEHAQGLHARNSLIMCGDWLDDPARFVVCWTRNGAVTGGTGQGLRVAAALNIPVFNLAVTPPEALWSWLDGK